MFYRVVTLIFFYFLVRRLNHHFICCRFDPLLRIETETFLITSRHTSDLLRTFSSVTKYATITFL